MNMFQAVCLFWWLVLGVTGHICWAAAMYRVFHKRLWRESDYWAMAPFFAAAGLFAFGGAVCFEPMTVWERYPTKAGKS
jgi:hypothetical protein